MAGGLVLTRLSRAPGLSAFFRSKRQMSTYLRTATSGNSKKYASQEERLTVEKLPKEAKVVICGGGAQGAAIAYKLAEAGWAEDVVLLEQGALGGGTTWHVTGLMGILKPSTLETRMAVLSRDLYSKLDSRGWYTGFREVGSLWVARTEDRMLQYRQMASSAVQHGIKCEVLETPDQVSTNAYKLKPV